MELVPPAAACMLQHSMSLVHVAAAERDAVLDALVLNHVVDVTALPPIA